MILASLLGEDRTPSDALWAEDLIASRLAVYEVWNRLHAHQAPASAQASARHVLSSILIMDLDSANLERALHPFPFPVKTLDGLHLATMDRVRSVGEAVVLASYDQRFSRVAAAMGFQLWDWDADAPAS